MSEITHPPAHRLDAVAAGDTDATVSDHLASCEACAHYVEELRGQATRFRATHDPAAFVARLSAGAGADAKQPRPLRSATLARIGVVAGPLLAAALVLLLVRARSGDGGPGLSMLPTSTPTATSTATTESRFKGGLVVAVVRERAGRQERLAGPFQVRADDRIRIEVSTDHDGPLAGGLLTDAGEWTALLAPVALEAGTHYSELAARFDASPTFATLLVGPPGDVERARATRDFAGLVAWRVTSEVAP